MADVTPESDIQKASAISVNEKPGGIALRTGPGEWEVDWYDYRPGTDVPSVKAMAWSLGGMPRYLAYARTPITVGQHSVACFYVARKLGFPKSWQRAALLHDGAEAIFGDLPGPLKAFLPDGCPYLQFLEGLEERIAATHDYRHPLVPSVKELDQIAYAVERETFATNENAGVPDVAEEHMATRAYFLKGPYGEQWSQLETYYRFLAAYEACREDN